MCLDTSILPDLRIGYTSRLVNLALSMEEKSVFAYYFAHHITLYHFFFVLSFGVHGFKRRKYGFRISSFLAFCLFNGWVAYLLSSVKAIGKEGSFESVIYPQG